MKDVLEVGGYKAVISYDPEIEMFRGEFLGLNGGADFYAEDVKGLHREAEASLKVFLEMCAEKGIEPEKSYSGNIRLRMSPELHAEVAAAASAEKLSINQWIVKSLKGNTYGHYATQKEAIAAAKAQHEMTYPPKTSQDGNWTMRDRGQAAFKPWTTKSKNKSSA